jgi:hypothetical protein
VAKPVQPSPATAVKPLQRGSEKVSKSIA